MKPGRKPKLVTRSGQSIGKGRISPALRSALVLLVEQAITIGEAAQRTGYKRESLAKALIKPHVRAELGAVKRAWLANQTARSWVNTADLANTAASEEVRLKANRVFLDVSGELEAKPDAKPQNVVQIVINHAPVGPQPIGHRLPGVIELQAVQGKRVDPSNSTPVGRG